jgi:hypothetical protein
MLVSCGKHKSNLMGRLNAICKSQQYSQVERRYCKVFVINVCLQKKGLSRWQLGKVTGQYCTRGRQHWTYKLLGGLTLPQPVQ